MSQVSVRLGLTRLLGFSSPEIPLIGLMMPIVVFLPPLYATYAGIPLETVGFAFLIARLWDVISDPVMGYLADRVRLPGGRRRGMMLIAAPFLMLGVWMAFRPPQDADLMYLTLWMIVLYTAFTVANISHYAWAAELSDDYDERARVMGGLQAGQVIGSLCILVVVAILQVVLGFPQHEAVAGVGLTIVLLIPPTFLLAMFCAPERTKRESVKRSRPKESERSIWRDPALWRLLLADLLNGFSTGYVGGLFIFLTGVAFGLPDLSGPLLLAYFVAGLIAVPIWVLISRKYGKHRAMCFAAVCNALACLLTLIVPAGSVIGAFGFCIAQGVGFGAAAFLPRAVMADIVDKDELNTGYQRSATFYALLTMTLKVGIALSIGISYFFLAQIGFEPDSATSSVEADALRWLFAAGVLAANVPVLFAMWDYPLDDAEFKKNRVALDLMKSTAQD